MLPLGSSRVTQERNRLKAVEGTGQWFVDSQEFQDWMIQSPSSLLWVFGKHGSGKSHVACRIIEELCFYRDSRRVAANCDKDLIAVAYVYCSSLADGDNHPRKLLLSIFRQLVEQHPYTSDMPTLWRGFGSDKDPASTGQFTIGELEQAISALSAWFQRTFIVFDGLDECSRVDSADGSTKASRADQEDFDRLCRYISTLSQNAPLNASIKTMVFSRPDYREIEDAFKGCVLVQTDSGANEDDIKKYITQKTESLTKNTKVLAEVKDKLLSGSEGMFLWVELFVNILNNECRSAKDMQEAMDEAPQSLSDVYERSLKRIMRQPPRVRKRALTAIMWVTNAKRPILKEEMQQLLAVRPDMDDWDEDCEFERDNGLLPECGDLIQLVNDQYRLIHFSLKEFLTVPPNEVESIREYWKLQLDQAEIMSEACLVFLNFETFKQGPKKTKNELQLLIERQPFIKYAASHWGNHLRDVDNMSASLTNLHRLARRFLYCDGARELSRQVALSQKSSYSHLVFPYSGSSTPLHMLAVFDLVSLAETIPDVVQQLGHKDMFESIPLDDALEHDHRHIAMWIVEKHIIHQDRVTFPQTFEGRIVRCYAAATNSWVEMLSPLVQLGEDINRKYCMETPLIGAAQKGHLQAVEALLSLGADINSVNDFGQTPLHRAVLASKSDVALRLIEAGADVSLMTSSNMTPLHLAAQTGDVKVAEALIRRGANINAVCAQFGTPIYYAVLKNKTDMVRYLIQGNADCNIKGPIWNCTMVAASQNSKESLEMLLSAGADATALNDEHRNAAHVAAANGHLDCIDILAGKPHN
jgi:ankyrin repeat protein